MKKIMLLLFIATSSLIASDDEITNFLEIIRQAKTCMRPIFKEIKNYATHPQKDMLIQKVTGMSPHAIVKENKQEMSDLIFLLGAGVIDQRGFYDGMHDVCVKLPRIIADEEKYTIFYCAPDGNGESVVAYYDEL